MVDNLKKKNEKTAIRLDQFHTYLQYFTILTYYLQSGMKSKTYPLIVDEYEPNTFEAVKHRIKQRFTSGGNKLVNIKLSNRFEVSF